MSGRSPIPGLSENVTSNSNTCVVWCASGSSTSPPGWLHGVLLCSRHVNPNKMLRKPNLVWQTDGTGIHVEDWAILDWTVLLHDLHRLRDPSVFEKAVALLARSLPLAHLASVGQRHNLQICTTWQRFNPLRGASGQSRLEGWTGAAYCFKYQYLTGRGNCKGKRRNHTGCGTGKGQL